jgi:GT2 family glycosyltransferase
MKNFVCRKLNTISVVIPTKNRPLDLVKAVNSVCLQSRLPDEFIIVDQSPGHESRDLVNAILSEHANINFNYIHDPFISGLVEAKKVASELARGDIVCFLEDDVVLEVDYIEQIEKGFDFDGDVIGCCGIITNPPPKTLAYKMLFNLFHRGIFRDLRVGIYGCFSGRENKLILSEMLSGGVSAWRSDVFRTVPFDIANGFHMLEDIDFSTRVAKAYGPHLYINPNARLQHHCSPLNREVLGPRQRRKLTEFIVYYKKRRNLPGATVSVYWLMVGLFFEAIFQSYSVRSFGPLQGFFAGIRDGVTKEIFIS